MSITIYSESGAEIFDASIGAVITLISALVERGVELPQEFDGWQPPGRAINRDSAIRMIPAIRDAIPSLPESLEGLGTELLIALERTYPETCSECDYYCACLLGEGCECSSVVY